MTSSTSKRKSKAPAAPLKDRLATAADELGFKAFGIAKANSTPMAGQRLQEWLDKGYHADMLWMEERVAQRSSPQGLWPEVQSVILLGLPYTPPLGANRYLENPDIATISVYAQGRDYHDVVKSKLKALARWLVDETSTELKVFVDTAPVMEKPLAEAAGLGWQGKHSNIVSRKAGNWLFLGAIYTTLDLEPHQETGTQASCGSCTACLTACPTGAIIAPYQVDANRCISYLTIENKGPIPAEFRSQLGNRIYGCDDCLDACPWNKHARFAADPALMPRAELMAPNLADFLQLDDVAFREIFSGSPIKRIGRNRFVRNCLYAAGNSKQAHYIPLITPLAQDSDPVLAEAAIWALDQLS